MIEVKSVVKTFDGFTALDGADITVPDSGVYGLVGPNGAGKSTVIRHITGIYRPDSGQVLVEGAPVRLTALEFKLLAYLVQNQGRMISKQELFEQVWENKFTGDGTLNVHIRKLREKIEANPQEPELLKTIWGKGYRIE